MEHIGEVIDQVRPNIQNTEHQEQKMPARGVATVNPLDMPTEHFQAGLDRRRSNRQAMMEWVAEALVEGVDYGRIATRRGLSEPSMWKPGAEKICGMLGITVHYPTLAQYEQVALQGIELTNIILRCELQDSNGQVVADGVGARSLRQDYGDLNKALKMAAKSAHIDATLRMAGLSEVFTQDLEDLPAAATQSQQSQQSDKSPGASQRISAEQRQHLESRIAEYELDAGRVRSWLTRSTRGQINSFEQLTPQAYERILEKLPVWAKALAKEAA